MKIQEHTYKPLPHFLTIKQSPIHGLGLFLTEENHLEKDCFLGVSHITASALDTITDDPNFEKVMDQYDNAHMIADNNVHSWDDLTIKELFKNNMIRTPLGGFINHSDIGNLDFIYLGYGLFGVITNCYIPKGSELTLDYKYTPCGVIKK